MPEEKERTIFDRVHSAYDREERRGNFIGSGIVERVRDFFGGMLGIARDEIKERPEKIEHEVRRQVGD